MNDERPSGLTDERMTFVLPLAGAHDLNTVRRNLLPSLDEFFPLGDLHQVLVIGKDDEVDGLSFHDIVSPGLNERIVVLSESAVAGTDSRFRSARGWVKQQVLKLKAARIVTTGRYCTLDSDMYLVRPCQLSDWVRAGRCRYDRPPPGLHRKWWKRAARALNVPLTGALETQFGVTPAILVTQIVEELLDDFERRESELTRAISRGATEYTLYWLFLQLHRQIADVYDHSLGPLSGRCIWKRRSISRHSLNSHIDDQFAPDVPFCFSLVQSTTGLVTQPVVDYISDCIRSRAA